jgi:hypothetical protein
VRPSTAADPLKNFAVMLGISSTKIILGVDRTPRVNCLLPLRCLPRAAVRPEEQEYNYDLPFDGLSRDGVWYPASMPC